MVWVESDLKDAWFCPVSPDHRGEKCPHDAFPPLLPYEMGNKMGTDKGNVPFPSLPYFFSFNFPFLCISQIGET